VPRISAGLLMYRIRDGKLQMLLAHPGGPFFKNKDDGAWTIPKGEIEPGEDLLEAAKREFKEETGITPTGPFIALKSGEAKGRQDRPRMGVRGRLRSGCDRQQHLYVGSIMTRKGQNGKLAKNILCQSPSVRVRGKITNCNDFTRRE